MKKTRIQYKNIKITYDKCFDLSLQNIKTFFIELFTNVYKVYQIDFLLVSKYKQDNSIIVLLILNKTPNFTSIKKFIYNEKEPIFENIVSPQTFFNEIKADNDYEYLEYGNFLSANEKLYKNSESKEKDAYMAYMDKLRAQKQADPTFSYDQARIQLYSYLDETNNSMRYLSSSTIEKNLKTFFLDTNNNVNENIHIYSIETFKDNEDVRKIKELIDEQLQELRKPGGRPRAIVIQGHTRIGKTKLIFSYCKHKNIKFNSMKNDFIFSRDYYFDDCEIDICDDIDLFTIKDKKQITSMCSCAQENVRVETEKYEKARVLKKNHLVIFLCNAHSSFLDHINNMKKSQALANYLRDNLIFYTITSHENLYKEDIKK